mmetsp:Transcript_32232/g.85995  ORF Transcript_32232/g.85995 Transcript_32232/m.85995 type:complete len:128 (-) Transcript_32232:734-1117(-)
MPDPFDLPSSDSEDERFHRPHRSHCKPARAVAQKETLHQKNQASAVVPLTRRISKGKALQWRSDSHSSSIHETTSVRTASDLPCTPVPTSLGSQGNDEDVDSTLLFTFIERKKDKKVWQKILRSAFL